jgi:cellulase/cellobiase CelA1
MTDQNILTYLVKLNIDKIIEDVNNKCYYKDNVKYYTWNMLSSENLNRTYCYQSYTEFGYCSSCSSFETLINKINNMFNEELK